MLDNGALRDLLAYSDKIKSEHLVVAEWNMNRYNEIFQYGIYKGIISTTTYSSADPLIANGENYILYDDEYVASNKKDAKFSTLASVFEPDRPDPGIVLLQQNSTGIITNYAREQMSISAMTTGSPRFYPFMKDRPYDYFNSAKQLDPDNAIEGGKSDPQTGIIQSTNPFVVYSSGFPCNKIVVKVQNHLSVPSEYRIDIMNDGTSEWTQVYEQTTSANFSTGILEIYYNAGTWSTTVSRVSNLSEITTPSTQAKKIKGIRLRVNKMTRVIRPARSYAVPLELIEISPRLEVDLSGYTESFSYNSSLGESEYGLPVGSLVTSTGNIDLSNEESNFMFTGATASYRLMSPNVEFRFYQKITASLSGDPTSPTIYTVPLKVMYADSWSINDYKTSVQLSDRFRLFEDIKVTDLAFFTRGGIPFSVLTLILLDNLGITGYEFKKTSNDETADNGEDIRIPNFFCNKDQTLMEVLQDIAVATQSCMYIDSSNKLSILTKENIASKSSTTYSSSAGTSGSTDFWMVGDSDFTGTGVPSYVSSSYVSNIVTFNESRVPAINDGDINYHTYGIPRNPVGEAVINDAIPKEYQ